MERFKDNDMVPIYGELRAGARKLSDGLRYIDSWVEPNLSRCFQLMKCSDLRLFQAWVLVARLRRVARNRTGGHQPRNAGSRGAVPRPRMNLRRELQHLARHSELTSGICCLAL
jgi:hypothetical protein